MTGLSEYPLGKATNFRQHKDGKGSIKYEECQGKEHDSIPMKFSDIKYSDLYPKKISIRDIEDSIHRQKPTVTLFDLAQIAAYENMSFGIWFMFILYTRRIAKVDKIEWTRCQALPKFSSGYIYI